MTILRISTWNEIHPNLLDLMAILLFLTENGIKYFPICRITILYGNFYRSHTFKIYHIRSIWYFWTVTSAQLQVL